MSAINLTLNVSGVAISATTATTLWQLIAAANQRVKIKEIGVSFNGTTNTNAPVLVQLLRQTSAGSGGSAGALKWRGPVGAETVQTSSLVGFNGSGEPTASDIIRTWYIHPQTGQDILLPIPDPDIMAGGERWGLRVNAPNAVSASSYVSIEE